MSEPRAPMRIAIAGRRLCLGGAAVGVLGLLGWFSGASFFTTIVPGQPPMMPNTALALVLTGVAGGLCSEHPGHVRRTLSCLAAIVVLAIGVGTLAEYALGSDLHIDQLLVRSQVGPYPGRPSPLTASALAFLAAAILLFDLRPAARARPSEWLVLSAGFTALVALTGQVFGAGPLYRLAHAPVIGVALPTGLSLLLTSVGLLLERPDAGVMRVATSSGPAGSLLRRLMLAAVLTPVLVGRVVTWLFAGLGVEDSALITATLSVVMTAVTLLLLLIAAVPFNHSHEALQLLRKRTRDLVEHASDAIFVADLDGRFMELNSAGCRMLGYSSEEIVGKAIVDIILPEDVGRLWQMKENLLRGGIEVGEWTLRRKDGAYLSAELSTKILPDGRWQGFLRDIGERKRLEQELRFSEAKSSGILAISADAIISIDEDQRITSFNEGAEKIFRYSKAEVIGTSLDILIPERFRASHRQHVTRFAGGRAVSRRMGERDTAIVGLRKNGEEFPADAAISKLDIGGKSIFTVALRDITNQKRLEEELRRAIQARDDVLGIVAHDLRTPLGTILTQAALLGRRGEESAEAIERAATRMNRLIQDLLDVTRMEAGRLRIEQTRIPARQVVAEFVEAQEGLASSASLQLRLDVATDLPDVWADHDRLLQVLENLFGNALNFTGPGGCITFGAAVRDGEVMFWVADTGAGIASADVPYIFDRFWQGRKAQGRGAGLGLPIVKSIVEAHGGHVWVESRPRRGSTFFFTIPMAPGQKPGARSEHNPAGRS